MATSAIEIAGARAATARIRRAGRKAIGAGFEDGIDLIHIEAASATRFEDPGIAREGADSRAAFARTILVLRDTDADLLDAGDFVFLAAKALV